MKYLIKFTCNKNLQKVRIIYSTIGTKILFRMPNFM